MSTGNLSMNSCPNRPKVGDAAMHQEPFSATKLMQVMRTIRSMDASHHLQSWDPDTAAIYYEEFMLDETPYILPMITLKTSPCSWLLAGGGCTMCGYHLAGSWNRPITGANLRHQILAALETLSPLERYPTIHIGSSGSLLDPAEVPDEICFELFSALQERGAKTVITESRPEHLVAAKLEAIQALFKGCLMIGIGLETSNDHWRSLSVNKGLSMDTYLKGVETLRRLGIPFSNHVLLGKPFLTASEDIEDVLTTIRFSLGIGSQFAILMVAHLQPHTLTHWLWTRRLYALPSLWSAIEILTRLAPDMRSRVVIKGIDKMIPEPLAFATTCHRCTKDICQLIESWNQTRDYMLIERALVFCDCRDQWLAELSTPIDAETRRHLIYENIMTGLLGRKSEGALPARQG